ncbi:MAG: C39 family peptidase [Patescibacteria group bacterium]
MLNSYNVCLWFVDLVNFYLSPSYYIGRKLVNGLGFVYFFSFAYHNYMKARLTILLILLLIVIIGTGYFLGQQYLISDNTDLSYIDKPIISTDLALNLSNNQNQPIADNTEIVLEPELNPKQDHLIKILKVPFTVQAPFANWDMPYQEACEEASIIMVADFVANRDVLRLEPVEADQRILELIEWEEDNGYAIDITALEVVKVLEQRFNINSRVEPYNAQVIKEEIQAGHPVILPAAGRLLDNPYFHQPGPLYHMLVVKGYDGDEFITNDPGTKRGENFRYRYSVFDRAVHDWNGGEVENGEQVMIVVLGL